MEQNSPTNTKLSKRRKSLLILPLLILPFVTLAFWALGGGKDMDSGVHQAISGINAELPKANISVRPKDKMSLYLESDRAAEAVSETPGRYGGPVTLDSMAYGGHLAGFQKEDINSVKIEQRLERLQRLLDASAGSHQLGRASVQSVNPATYGLQPGEESGEQLDRLNKLNELIAGTADKHGGGGTMGAPDVDMQQINTMLDKILAIQHPEKTTDALKEMSRKDRGNVYAVALPTDDVKVPFLPPLNRRGRTGELAKRHHPSHSTMLVTGFNKTRDSGHTTSVDKRGLTGAFFDIDQSEIGEKEAHNTVQAVIAEEQTLVSGAAVKMRLTADVVIQGTRIPSGYFIYGTGTVSGERLKIEVTHIRFRDRIFPVRLNVFDLDGMEGIRIPGAIGRAASREGADRALQSVQMMSLDPGLSAQMAGAGIETVKGLLSKKVRLVRVTVKAGYPVLLLDEQEQK